MRRTRCSTRGWSTWASTLGYRHVLLHERDAGMRLAHLRPPGLESIASGEVPLEMLRAWLRREHASLMALARVRQLLRGSQHQRGGCRPSRACCGTAAPRRRVRRRPTGGCN